MLCQDELMNWTSRLLDEKLAALATKEDLQALQTTTLQHFSENKRLKKEMENLKHQQEYYVDKLNKIENRSRCNNIIFKGLQYNKNDEIKEVAHKFCANYLKMRQDLWINRALVLGAWDDNRPIISHSPNNTNITCIKTISKILEKHSMSYTLILQCKLEEFKQF